ncbi:MAG: hypothetical protein AB7F40_08755 [Victivallaceae bacterium]
MKKLNIAIVLAALALSGCAYKCHKKEEPCRPCDLQQMPPPGAPGCKKKPAPPKGECPMKGAPAKPECAKPATPPKGECPMKGAPKGECPMKEAPAKPGCCAPKGDQPAVCPMPPPPAKPEGVDKPAAPPEPPPVAAPTPEASAPAEIVVTEADVTPVAITVDETVVPVPPAGDAK